MKRTPGIPRIKSGVSPGYTGTPGMAQFFCFAPKSTENPSMTRARTATFLFLSALLCASPALAKIQAE